jgi:alpha-1,3/alpha-1,6-mannosyltransferase
LVNSKFTSRIFYTTFTSLKDKKIEVLYPSLNTAVFDTLLNHASTDESHFNNDDKFENKREFEKSKNKKFTFLSINRYERKKDLKLAINAFSILKKKLKSSFNCHLIMAGGYDYRVEENVQHFIELKSLAKSFGVEDDISFLRSISDTQKVSLLKMSYCLLYTPTNEHFGIVPIEAMYCEKPVIATNTGGPLETIADNITGYLVPPEAEKFADAMLNLISNPHKQKSYGAMARRQIIEKFSYLSFQQKLNNILLTLINSNQKIN